jgi:UDP-N-acetylmuramyl pentapeptide phosphotransferase/UDP-N-acetylglucosamine-1-phosphate transferase
VVVAALLSLIAMVLALVYVSQHSDHIVLILIGFVVVAATVEILLQKIAKREVKPRITKDG